MINFVYKEHHQFDLYTIINHVIFWRRGLVKVVHETTPNVVVCITSLCKILKLLSIV